MGAFSELSSGLVDYDTLLRERNIIQDYPFKFIQTVNLDRIDQKNINFLKETFRIKKVGRMSPLEQVQKMFENTENFCCVFNKLEKGGWNDFIGLKSEIERISNYEGKPDTYIGTASYVSKKNNYDKNGKKLPRRTQSNVKDIVLLSQDLDYYKLGISTEEALQVLGDLIKAGKLEMPNMIIFSGNGLQLIWLIDNVLAKKGTGPEKLFKAVQNRLLKTLAPLNSDKVVMNVENVIRLDGTINSKNDQIVRTYILRTDRLKLGYFKENYLPIPKPNRIVKKPFKRENKPSEGQKVVNDSRFWNEYSLNYQRAQDVFTILKYKQQKGQTLIGIRQHLALVLRFHTLVYTDGDFEAAKKEVERFWDELKEREGTSFDEIDRRSASAERFYKEWKGEVEWKGKGKYNSPGLFYKNATLIKEWNLSVECQVHLKTIKIRNNEYNKKQQELYRRKNGVVTREEYLKKVKEEAKNSETNVQVKELYLAGKKQVEISNIVGISKSRVSQIIKDLGLKKKKAKKRKKNTNKKAPRALEE